MGIKTIGLDINESQLAMAKKCGADAVYNSMTNKDYVAEITKLTGKGCHAAAVYSASNAAYAGAPNVLRTGGLLMVIGIAPKGLDFINTFDLTTGRYRIKADSTGIPQRMRKAVDFTGKHRYDEARDIELGCVTLICRTVYNQKSSSVRSMTFHKWLPIWRLERQIRDKSLFSRLRKSKITLNN
jgi:D-arabinose 1-dehydrogenase-like Zn-dependent alcohol dehydrogenase